MTDVDLDFQLMVVGGGPAGMSTALAASRAGVRVVLVDERPTLGGQIYKQPGPGFTVTDLTKMDRQFRFGRSLIDAVLAAEITVLLRTSVLSVEGTRVFYLTEGDRARSVSVAKLVLAPGAHDRPVAFPGWTLPGVITAGGLQTMAKTQRVVPGNRILFAGSGPVALAFPAQLTGYGAGIIAALEAGPAPRPMDLIKLAGAAPGNFSLLRDALQYRTKMLKARIPVRYGRMVIRAEGAGRVERVIHAAVDRQWRVIPGTEKTEFVDTLCVGYGFIPSIELLRLVGCEFDFDDDLGGQTVRRDEWMRTSVPDVYSAGDGTGVEGSFVAIDEGELAGVAVAMDLGMVTATTAATIARGPRRRLARRRALTLATHRLYAVGPGVYELPDPETIICRCEVVRLEAISRSVETTDDINVVKAETRAGMGLCQGKNCQRHIAAMISRRHRKPLAEVSLASPRPPVRPVPIRALADDSITGLTLFLPDASVTSAAPGQHPAGASAAEKVVRSP